MSNPNLDPDKRPLVRLVSLAPVGTWSWVSAADQCSICRNSLMTLCMKCQATQGSKPMACAVSWGTCGHTFHKHCVDEWIKSRQVCPIDESPWSEKQVADISS